MKTKRIIHILASAAFLFLVAARANDIEPGKEFYTAIKARNPIVLDGDLSEWTGAAVLADPRFYVKIGAEGTAAGKGTGGVGAELVFFEEYAGGTWTGPDDHTSAVQVVYDDDNVYFGFVVTDEYHENAANSAWNGDSVQLMVANDARDTQVGLYNYALGGVEGALGDVIVMHEAGPGGTEAVVTRNSETKRTIYEIKLPKEALELDALTGGVQFGLGMAINDGDEDTPGQKGWGGLGAHSIVFGKTPSETALITLATANDIEPGKEFYTANPAPGAITVDGDLSDFGGAPVLSDPRFYVKIGAEGTAAGKGTAGVGAELVLFEEYAGGVWTGADDHTSAVQIVYDADNVYFGFVVTDDYHENAANSAWNGDSVQLMVADGKQAAQIALYNYALGGVEGALGDVIVMHEAGPGGTEAVVTRNSETKRTIYEIKLPKESMGLETLDLGTQFGLGMAINDGDEDTPGQKGWGGLGAHSIVFGKSPNETALVTLGVGGLGGDLLFLSAIDGNLNGFSFRANDKGSSIVDPDSAKLYIDGVLVPLVASPKVLDATDFTYTRPTPYGPGSKHSYLIEIQDTNGNLVTDSSTFTTMYFGVLTRSMQAVSVDTSKRGFIWNVFQNEDYIHTTLAETELALAGQLVDGNGTPVTENRAASYLPGPALADGVTVGPLLQFEIPGTINLNQTPDTTPLGNFTPDDYMPGIPGLTGMDDGIDAEIITFVDLPEGWITLGVTSDDGFRSQAGYINDPATGVLLGELEGVADRTFDVLVQDAGIYPMRTIYVEGGGGAHIELFSVKEDGTRVLLNDTANGGYTTYRSGVAPEPPTEFSVAIQVTDGNVEITWTEAGLVLQESTNLKAWTDVDGATSPYQPALAAGEARFYRLRQ